MVKRFDISARRGRYHMVSLRTPCKERPGIYMHRYSDLAQVLRLAPAFDLVPDVSGRGEHTLPFQQGYACPTGAEVIAVAAEWGVPRAARIVEDVVTAAKAFETTARGLKVRNPVSLQKVCADVSRRIGLLSRPGATML